MMSKIFFRYKVHPGDLLRSTDIIELPDPDKNLEYFLVWFLSNYQSDDRVTLVDDLSKIIHNEFVDENENDLLENIRANKTKDELLSEIESLENVLKLEAFKNFYYLLLSNRIEILDDNEK